MAKDAQDDLQTLRHDAAHVMATAVLELWPETKVSIGPPIESGFYYDFEFPEEVTVTDADLERIEEAKARDHRKLGPQLGIFRLRPEAPGMPFWLPNGTALLRTIEAEVQEQLRKRGY